MPIDVFVPQRPPATPTTYAFASTHPAHAGLLKVGYTKRLVADLTERFERMAERVLFIESKPCG